MWVVVRVSHSQAKGSGFHVMPPVYLYTSSSETAGGSKAVLWRKVLADYTAVMLTRAPSCWPVVMEKVSGSGVEGSGSDP